MPNAKKNLSTYLRLAAAAEAAMTDEERAYEAAVNAAECANANS